MKGYLFILLLMVAGQNYAGEWFLDTINGCKVWNKAPQPNETMKWTGACLNGFADGKGELSWLYDGKISIYKGSMKNGELDGIRVYTGANGFYKEGFFIKGNLIKECSKTECDPDYLYKDFDAETKVDIVMSKIINSIKNNENIDALIYMNYLQTLNVKLPEAFYPQYIKVLDANKDTKKKKNVAKKYIQKYGKTGKFYGEMIEALSR